MQKQFFVSLLLILSAFTAQAQQLTQTVRGTVTDKISNVPLESAVVTVTDVEPAIGAATDENGLFKINDVPIGKHTMKISFIGYKELVLQGIVVNSGKEVVLNLTLEEDIEQMSVVEVNALKNQRDALNEMSTVSTRTFSVEETQKFAAAINDPGRMASSYSGVISTDDGNNAISVRGNSPYGLLWRMEGVDIPNPNHFSSPASSGGGISIISAQLLSNSDFTTGAFAAEYGNAMSGVFDLKLRKGNNEQHEYTFQAGLLGVDLAAEGPFKRGQAGSYLVNYRLSSLSMLQMIGLDIGDAVTNFQDLSYNVFVPTKNAGSFSIFGFTGLSGQTQEAKQDSSLWTDEDMRYEDKFIANTYMNGLKHILPLNEKTYLQSSLVYSLRDLSYVEYRLDDDYKLQKEYDELSRSGKWNLNFIVNHKFNARHSMRSGVYLNLYDSEFRRTYLDEELNVMITPLNQQDEAYTMQAFSQWRYRVAEPLTLNLGVHYLHLLDNNTSSIEPRAAIRYELNELQSVSFGYGLHSQMQPLGVYGAQVQSLDGTYSRPNENIEFNKAHHLVLAYDRSLSKNMYVKVETYYQHLFNIAVEDSVNSLLSTLNNEWDYITEPLTNKGFGRNYGVELTLEQRTYKNMYFLLSGSFFQSEFKALDGVWHNTRFNTNYAFVLTAGKEWKVGKTEKNKTMGINLRATFVGGLRNTPIDVAASMQSGETEYITTQAYEGRADNYFRPDVRFSLKRNFKRMTSTLSLDLQNATNTKNAYGSYFDAETGTVKEYYNLPLIPVLAYKMEF